MGRWFLNFSFNGRARRSHTWANYFAWIGVWLVLIVAMASASAGFSGDAAKGGPAALIVLLLMLAALVCSVIDHMAITFRRAHDTGRSGWIWVVLLIPLLNLLALYWLLIEDSQQGPNKYGPPVKAFYEPSVSTPA